MAMEEVGGNMINAVIVVYLNRHEVEFNWSYMKMGQKFCLWVGSGAWGGFGAVYTFALFPAERRARARNQRSCLCMMMVL